MEKYDWPSIRALREVLNTKDEDTKIYHGHAGRCHFKDVAERLKAGFIPSTPLQH